MARAAAVLWVLTFLLEAPLAVRTSGPTWIQMLVLGVFGSALAVFGIAVAWFVFGKVPSWTLLVGLPITFAGVGLVQWARQREWPSG